MAAEKPTKTAARKWATRARAELRDAEWALSKGDWAQANQFFMAASAACAESERIAETLMGEDQ